MIFAQLPRLLALVLVLGPVRALVITVSMAVLLPATKSRAGQSDHRQPAGPIIIEERLEQPDLRARLSDIRFDGPNSLLVGSNRRGVLRFGRNAGLSVLEHGLAVTPGGHFSSMAAHVGSSERWIVAGQIVGSISWSGRGRKTVNVFHGFDAIVDLDVFETTVAVMAARRDGRGGTYAEDGSIVSIGTLGESLDDLRPLHLSITGPGARSFGRCSQFQIGSVRFLRDGRLIVLPGVEPGIYRYSPSGRLEKTWDTASLGIDADCVLSDREVEETSIDLEVRVAWLNRWTVVDDMVPLANAIGLIVRRFENGQATWQLWVLHPRGQVEKHALPFRRPPNQRVKADTDGRLLALLFQNVAKANPVPQDIVMVSLPASARSRVREEQP